MAKVKVFKAKRILTMNPSQPFAEYVAIQDGRILALGNETEIRSLGSIDIDTRFENDFLLPGFVEGHCHLTTGASWRDIYLGYYDRPDPDGRIVAGLKSIEAVISRLREASEADQSEAPLVGWAFDPIYIQGPRLTVADLDLVSTTRPIVIAHASGSHIVNVNSAALRLVGLDRDSDVDGLVRDAAGELTGELLGHELTGLTRRRVLPNSSSNKLDSDAMQTFGKMARRVGVTTATDLVSDMSDETIAVYKAATSAADYPVRIAAAMSTRFYNLDDGIERFKTLTRHNSDSLFFGTIKLHVDGSIQGFSARLRWPGYHNGAPNGLWYLAPSQLGKVIEEFHRAGATLHMHTNGDEATEAAVDMLERAITAYPRPDHRHTLQHCQMPDLALYRRIKNLGLCCNIFANHIYYWGEAHIAETMGLSRAMRMDACGTALRLGIPFAIHSDAPITPLDPLFTAWCAVMRQTSSGRVLGEGERISVMDALHAITLGPAYTLKLDHLIGSIEVGKFADFAILKSDPLEEPPANLKDIPVVATVRGGEIFSAHA